MGGLFLSLKSAKVEQIYNFPNGATGKMKLIRPILPKNLRNYMKRKEFKNTDRREGWKIKIGWEGVKKQIGRRFVKI